MRVPTHAPRVLWLVAVAAAGGCHSAHKMPLAPGSVPLRGGVGSPRADAQMRAILIGKWRSVGEPYELRATFLDDRRFVFEVTGADLGSVFPGAFREGIRRVEGTWFATSKVLKVEVPHPGGTTTIPLTWLDGKLNIQVGGIQLRRLG